MQASKRFGIGFRPRHHVASQLRSCFASRLVIEVAPKLNQVLCSAGRYHFASSGQVLVRNCTSVLAVITALQSGWHMAHSVSIATRADLPIPWPDDTELRVGWWRVAGF